MSASKREPSEERGEDRVKESPASRLSREVVAEDQDAVAVAEPERVAGDAEDAERARRAADAEEEEEEGE